MRQFLSILSRHAVFALLLLIALDNGMSATKADYLVVERPQQLVIYNQYQQQASASEKSELLSHAPFKILNANDVLGDGFTPCMKVEFGGRNFFIGKDQHGAPLGAEHAGARQMYRGAEVLDDTIEILKTNRLIFSDPQRSRTSRLSGTDRALRIFQYNEAVYVKLLGVNELYGWVNLAGTSGQDWRIAKELDASVPDQLRKILPQVEATLNNVNVTLARLYEHFNQKFSREDQPPQWQLQQSGNAILCVLLPETSRDGFAESSRLLAKNMEGLLLGTDLQVTSSPGRLEIRTGGSE